MKWYEELFENYAENYEKEVFTQGTKGEVDFIEKEINYNKDLKILDIGCGTGRHSIELTKRGYQVTGFDLSENQLKKAQENAQKEGLNISFLKKDAREFNFNQEFDLAIMLCEGAFPLMETDEMNYVILENAYKSIKKDGKLIFTTLNGLFAIFQYAKNYFDNPENFQNTFDLMTFRDKSEFEFTDDSENTKSLSCDERYYTPSEITWYLKTIGFKKSEIFSCDLGKLSREKHLTPKNFEMLVIAQK